ncbi:hypothetical protein V6N13_148209 [Hibiscus sabdariffa]
MGFCVERNECLFGTDNLLDKNLKELFFEDDHLSRNRQTRFDIILNVVEAFECLQFSCDPFIHEDIEPTNVLFDFEYRAKISDFGLLRIKVEGEYGVNLFCQGFRNQKLWKSHELYGIFEGTASAETPAIGTHIGSNNTEILVDSLIENSVLELLVQNLQHLLDKDPDDMSAIYNTLASIENMIEVKHAVAELVCERTKLLRWLLAKIKAVAMYKSKDPKTSDEEEMLENLFDCLCCLLMPFKIKEMFVKAEGVELMIIIMKQKKSTYASAIRALDFSMTKYPPTCEQFEYVLGLKTALVFSWVRFP